ncbi:MAG: hypothetical protein Q8O46_04555 [bacterium]|nr:hypothetical protein [bacterium]
MDIKDLNRVQLILLALLLSFVTSIATGITTVTLMQQAPSSVTVPINRIVKQTVEKIVPIEGKTTIQTVVIKEEDLVVDAIEKNQSAVFSISKEALDADGKNIEVEAGRGVVVSDKGVIVVDKMFAPEKGTYYVTNGSGKFKADFISSSEKDNFSFLKIGTPIDEKNKITFSLPTFGDITKMKTGQKILVFGDAISSFIFEGNKDIKIVVTKSNAGSLVLNLDGEVLGMAFLNDFQSFVSIDVILKTFKTVEKSLTQ